MTIYTKYNTKILERLEPEVDEATLRKIEWAFIECKWYKGMDAMRSYLTSQGEEGKKIWDLMNTPFEKLGNKSLVHIIYIYPTESEKIERRLLSQTYKRYQANINLDYNCKTDFIMIGDEEIVFVQVKYSLTKHKTLENAIQDYKKFLDVMDHISSITFDFDEKKLTYLYVSYIGDPKEGNRMAYPFNVRKGIYGL